MYLFPSRSWEFVSKIVPGCLVTLLLRDHHLQDFAHCKAVKSASSADWSYYSHLEMKLTRFYDQVKQHMYFKDLASSLWDTPSKFWRYFRFLSWHSGSVNGNLLSVTADAFNNHFLSIPLRQLLLYLVVLCHLAINDLPSVVKYSILDLYVC